MGFWGCLLDRPWGFLFGFYMDVMRTRVRYCVCSGCLKT